MDDYPDDDELADEVERAEARLWYVLDCQGNRWVYEDDEESDHDPR